MTEGENKTEWERVKECIREKENEKENDRT